MIGDDFERIRTKQIVRAPPQLDDKEDRTPLERAESGGAETAGKTVREIATPERIDFTIERDDDSILEHASITISNPDDSEESITVTVSLQSLFGGVGTDLWETTFDVTVGPGSEQIVHVSGDGDSVDTQGRLVSGLKALPPSDYRISIDIQRPALASETRVTLRPPLWVDDLKENGTRELYDPRGVLRQRMRADRDGVEFPTGIRDSSGRLHQALVGGTGGDDSDGNGFRMDPRSAEPEDPSDFQFEAADGSNWDPGGGKGVYVYINDNWSQIA